MASVSFSFEIILIPQLMVCSSNLAKEELKNNRIRRRVYELLSKAATSGPSHPTSGQRELHSVFFQKPDRFLDSEEGKGHVAGVHSEKTMLRGNLPACKFGYDLA
ncbi:unnamed protein product [Ilex paraguariensis]|uniref:Uncharacterized protein n=1 Tax=Ilex paraguariensis TaxID=185542 RepID=A0ABC8SE59_9AQUA